MEQEVEEQKFGVFITRTVNKKSKQMQVQMKTKGEGIPLSEAIIILEGWIRRVKQELRKPYNFDKMIFGSEEK